MRVQHFDRGELQRHDVLPNGSVRADAYLTRVGVFEYRNLDGTIRRELRLPEEVFSEKSLDTLRGTTLTLGHPRGPVNEDNNGTLSVGTVQNDVRRDGEKVRSTIIVQRKDAIKALKRGTRQLSCGYSTVLEMTPGVTENIDGVEDGLEYDCIQRDIVHNHAAIVDRGRAGPDVAARMDAHEWRCDDFAWREDEHRPVTTVHTVYDGIRARARMAMRSDNQLAFELGMLMFEKGLSLGQMASAAGTDENGMDSILSGMAVPTALQIDGLAEALDVSAVTLKDLLPEAQRATTDGEDAMKFQFNHDGVVFEIECDERTHAALTRKFEKDAEVVKLSQAAVDHAKADADKERGRADALEAKVKEAEQARADAEDPKRIDEAVNARIKLHEDARKVLGKDEKLDGLSDDEIKRKVVLTVDSGAADKLADCSPDYLQARFDGAVVSFREDTGRKANADLRKAAENADSAGGTDKVRQARADMIKRGLEEWRRPLSASLDAPQTDPSVQG